MLILSSRWSALACTATVLLGWLVPATLTADILTSQAFQVLTDGDNMGGSCTSRLDQVNQLIPEVQQLIEAATDTIDRILDSPKVPELRPQKKKDRLRMLLLARRFFGTGFSTHRMAVDSNSEQTLNAVKDNFNLIRDQIERTDRTWRFACDDSWAQYITTLQTDYGGNAPGTPIQNVPGLGGMLRDWAFFDRGGEGLRPASNVNDVETQRTWYISQAKGWSEDGPCAGITKGGPTAYPYAETLEDQKLIYFCPRAWDRVGGALKRDMREFEDHSFGEDGTELLDEHMSPGAILLHEMTHQVFDAADHAPEGLGYGFTHVQEGNKHPEQAINNADTYPYFAVAAYLSQVEWHTGLARKIGYQG